MITVVVDLMPMARPTPKPRDVGVFSADMEREPATTERRLPQKTAFAALSKLRMKEGSNENL
ncbi:hypothetical protein [Micromonospora chokoriensis]